MEPSTLLLAILTASICLYYFILSKLSYFERLKIPHVRPIPLFGNMAPFIFRRECFADLLQRIYNLFPDTKYFGFYEFLTPTYVIRDPDLISTIAIKQFDNFCDHRGFANKILDPITSQNLFEMKGDHWREMRKLLSPSFTSSKMKMMFRLMCHCAENFVNFVATQSGEISKTYDIKDLLCRKAMNFEGILSLKFLMNRSFPLLCKLLKLRLFGPEVEIFFRDVVSGTVKVRDEQGIVRPDMIQLMMETRNKDSGPEINIDYMTAQAFVFFAAGFDSVSTAMCFMMHHVGLYPDVQRKLKEEIDDVLRQTNGKPTFEAINCMKYLNAVVNESLRLYPIAPFLDRICVKETKLPPATQDGEPITIKPGDSIWFPSFSLHRDPKYYPHPEKFDPDRFLNGNVDNSIYMPFGIGPRICIGNRFALMESKIMLFYLLWRCDVELDVKTRIPMVLKKSFAMVPDGGFWLKLRARKSKAPFTQCFVNGQN
ncbi:PREDICTED: cytochrome P450 9e2-like [Wasmannia auropunctata]|uniref:cytochrome P450 9e2-like n=1 Tax=Wasmannia auropunctata TaxID=64793 RepID=UPI0005F0331E|nr:PREDICTED: cytochrome P450 9e2-like [Wasmannia auropunctata]